MQSNQSLNPTSTEWNLRSQYKGLMPIDLAYIGINFVSDLASELYNVHKYNIDVFNTPDDFMAFLQKSSLHEIPGVILLEITDKTDKADKLVSQLKKDSVTSGIIIILLCSKKTNTITSPFTFPEKINDIYYQPLHADVIAERIRFLIKLKLLKSNEVEIADESNLEYKPPLLRRIFSFTVALLLIILASPILLITAILIRIESKGPIIYKSKRAGTGYKIFDFYKFRSMVVDADKKLEALSKTNNQYSNNGKNSDQPFVKILNDPRVTKMGRIIRKTSIDELPQLFNVLKGDMMLVGNRPLPLYEAEMLTSDAFAMRFLGPAGITGLWQISKRGKAEMSDQERKELDNYYAKYSSFWMDIKIILKTIPAVFQKENV
ncbi:MAG: sugar transferase [Niabella sp.]